jgi:hypothetical protein
VTVNQRTLQVAVESSNDHCAVTGGLDAFGAPTDSGPIWLGYMAFEQSIPRTETPTYSRLGAPPRTTADQYVGGHGQALPRPAGSIADINQDGDRTT